MRGGVLYKGKRQYILMGKSMHVLEKTGPWFLENRPGGV
jgi:hypothetical protein